MRFRALGMDERRDAVESPASRCVSASDVGAVGSTPPAMGSISSGASMWGITAALPEGTWSLRTLDRRLVLARDICTSCRRTARDLMAFQLRSPPSCCFCCSNIASMAASARFGVDRISSGRSPTSSAKVTEPVCCALKSRISPAVAPASPASCAGAGGDASSEDIFRWVPQRRSSRDGGLAARSGRRGPPSPDNVIFARSFPVKFLHVQKETCCVLFSHPEDVENEAAALIINDLIDKTPVVILLLYTTSRRT